MPPWVIFIMSSAASCTIVLSGKDQIMHFEILLKFSHYTKFFLYWLLKSLFFSLLDLENLYIIPKHSKCWFCCRGIEAGENSRSKTWSSLAHGIKRKGKNHGDSPGPQFAIRKTEVLAPPACPHVAAAKFEGRFLPRDVPFMQSCPLPSLWNYRLPSEVPSCDCIADSVPDTSCIPLVLLSSSQSSRYTRILFYFSFVTENWCPSYWRILWPDVRYIKKFRIWIYFILSVTRIT